MIVSFKNKDTEAVFDGLKPRRLPPDIIRTARRKLELVDAAKELSDSKLPPSNKLHGLGEDRAGQHAIRINDQWRIVFTWTRRGAENVEITNYQ